MLQYPKKLDIIFDKLLRLSIEPIIVGGYVRDYFLHKVSKDIDIELYGIASYSELENILSEFGKVNSVGKSFGVCKLNAANMQLDFSLPRRDSKITTGHTGFNIEVDQTLDFKTATSRRDFTINSVGYSIRRQKILDPFHGLNDLESKVLKAVDISKFSQDPLRVLRAVQFSARFDFNLDEELFALCKKMIQHSVLHELPKERIFEEFKKLFLKSQHPSKGLLLLKDLGAFDFFIELNTLTKSAFNQTLKSIDKMASLHISNNKTNITLMFCVVCYQLEEKQISSFLDKFSKNKKFLKTILLFIEYKDKINLNSFSSYDVYKLATQLSIENFCFFLSAIYVEKKDLQNVLKLRKLAKSVNVLEHPAKALLQGKDLVSHGLEPSPKFSTLLNAAYEAQIQGKFSTHDAGLHYLEATLLA